MISVLKSDTVPRVYVMSTDGYINSVKTELAKLTKTSFSELQSKNESEEHLATAMDYFENGNYSGAKMFLSMSIESLPNINAYSQFGIIQAMENNYHEAIVTFSEAIALYWATYAEYETTYKEEDPIPSCFSNRAACILNILNIEKGLN